MHDIVSPPDPNGHGRPRAPLNKSSGFYGSLSGLGVHVSDIVGIVAAPGRGGYFLVGMDGGVFTFGNAPFFGSLPGIGVSVNDITRISEGPERHKDGHRGHGGNDPDDHDSWPFDRHQPPLEPQAYGEP
jgi:hypothetical protein